MSKEQRIIYNVMGVLLGIMIAVGFLKYFDLYWVEADTSYVKVTINFLFPMEQNQIKEHIQFVDEKNHQRKVEYSIRWLNSHTVDLILREQGEIKGYKGILKIDNAPSIYRGMNKSMNIPIQFKADIQLVSASQFLISSTNSFVVAFNTPISLQQLNKAFQSERKFDIKPYANTDDTQFIFTPKKALKNGETYVLLFKKGMYSKSRTLLKENQSIILKVDQKPTITKTYPINGDKWIGLYPRMLLETKEPIVKAEAYINGITIEGKLVDSNHAYFLLDDLLKPEVAYQLAFQVQVASGEKSEIKQVDFVTTTLSQKRFWLDIHIGDLKEIRCYQGTQLMRTIPFEMTKKIEDVILGTYYLQGKAEVYEDSENHLGGNYWMNISNQLGIQGMLRNAYWQPVNDFRHAKNMITSDEDAAWLYEKMEQDMMIIVRR